MVGVAAICPGLDVPDPGDIKGGNRGGSGDGICDGSCVVGGDIAVDDNVGDGEGTLRTLHARAFDTVGAVGAKCVVSVGGTNGDKVFFDRLIPFPPIGRREEADANARGDGGGGAGEAGDEQDDVRRRLVEGDAGTSLPGDWDRAGDKFRVGGRRGGVPAQAVAPHGDATSRGLTERRVMGEPGESCFERTRESRLTFRKAAATAGATVVVAACAVETVAAASGVGSGVDAGAKADPSTGDMSCSSIGRLGSQSPSPSPSFSSLSSSELPQSSVLKLPVSMEVRDSDGHRETRLGATFAPVIGVTAAAER